MGARRLWQDTGKLADGRDPFVAPASARMAAARACPGDWINDVPPKEAERMLREAR